MFRFRSLPGYTCHLIGTCPLSAIDILNLIIISILGTAVFSLWYQCHNYKRHSNSPSLMFMTNTYFSQNDNERDHLVGRRTCSLGPLSVIDDRADLQFDNGVSCWPASLPGVSPLEMLQPGIGDVQQEGWTLQSH